MNLSFTDFSWRFAVNVLKKLAAVIIKSCWADLGTSQILLITFFSWSEMKSQRDRHWEVEEVKCTFPELSLLPLQRSCCVASYGASSRDEELQASSERIMSCVGFAFWSLEASVSVGCYLCRSRDGSLLVWLLNAVKMVSLERKKPACDSLLWLWTWHLLLMFANVKTFVLSGFTVAALEHPDTRSQSLTGRILRSETNDRAGRWDQNQAIHRHQLLLFTI